MIMSSWITGGSSPSSPCVGDWSNFPTGFTDTLLLSTGGNSSSGFKNVIRLDNNTTGFVVHTPGFDVLTFIVYSKLTGTSTSYFISGFGVSAPTRLRCQVVDNPEQNGGFARAVIAYTTNNNQIEVITVSHNVNTNVQGTSVGTHTIAGIVLSDFDVAYNGLTGSSSEFFVIWGNNSGIGSELQSERFGLQTGGDNTLITSTGTFARSPGYVPELVRAGWNDVGVSATATPSSQLIGYMCVITTRAGGGVNEVSILAPDFSIDVMTTIDFTTRKIWDLEVTGGLQGDSELPAAGDNCRFAFICYVADPNETNGTVAGVYVNAIYRQNSGGSTDFQFPIYTYTIDGSSLPIVQGQMCRMVSMNDADSNIFCMFHGDDEDFTSFTRGTLLVAPGTFDINTSGGTFGSRSDTFTVTNSSNVLGGVAGRQNCEMFYVIDEAGVNNLYDLSDD